MVKTDGYFDKAVPVFFVNPRRRFLNRMPLGVGDKPVQNICEEWGNRDFDCRTERGIIDLTHSRSSFWRRLHRTTDCAFGPEKSVVLLFYSVAPMFDWNSAFVKLECVIPSVSRRGCYGR